MGYESQRGDTVYGVSRTHLIVDASLVEHHGKGHSQERTWEMLVCWPEPDLLALATRSITGWVAWAFLTAVLASPLTSRKFQPKRTSRCSPCLLRRSCLCLPPTQPPARFALSVQPKPPSSGPAQMSPLPKPFQVMEPGRPLALLPPTAAPNLEDLRAF